LSLVTGCWMLERYRAKGIRHKAHGSRYFGA
jgi:hypothetical protein